MVREDVERKDTLGTKKNHKRRAPGDSAIVASAGDQAGGMMGGRHGHLQDVRNTISRLLMDGQRVGIRHNFGHTPNDVIPGSVFRRVRFNDINFSMRVPESSATNGREGLYDIGHYPSIVTKKGGYVGPV